MVVIEKLRIEVLVIEKDIEPYVVRIWNNLDELRKIIGNESIEVKEYEKALLVYDDDSLKKMLPINRYIDDKAIRGVFIIAGNNEKELDWKELTTEQIKKYKNQFSIQREEDMELEE